MSSNSRGQSVFHGSPFGVPIDGSDKRLVVLVLMDWYLPGMNAGGPVQSVSRLMERLAAACRWNVITRDRDLGGAVPYASIDDGEWQAVGAAHVRYLRAGRGLSLRLWSALQDTKYDVAYLNSFFSRLSVAFLFCRRFGLIADRPFLIAPRGEFSPHALGFNSNLKRMYIRVARFMRLCDDAVWVASTSYEASDIRREFATGHPAFRVKVAQDLVAPVSTATLPIPDKNRGTAKLVFLSRIDRMKNLDGALRFLRRVQGNVMFDVYGPCSDDQYLAECRTIATELPESVVVRFLGPVPPDNVIRVLGRYDLFVLPSLSENFGHVIYEALASGCPILISDQTAWRGLENKGVGWDFPIADRARFEEAIQWMVDADASELVSMRSAARTFAAASVDHERSLQDAWDVIRLAASGAR